MWSGMSAPDTTEQWGGTIEPFPGSVYLCDAIHTEVKSSFYRAGLIVGSVDEMCGMEWYAVHWGHVGKIHPQY